MNSTPLIAAVISGAGLLTSLLSIPMILRRVPPNRLYGIRIKASFASESDWYRINAIGGRYLAVAGLLILTVGLLGFFPPLSTHRSYPLIAGAVAWLAIVLPCARLCFLKPSASAK